MIAFILALLTDEGLFLERTATIRIINDLGEKSEIKTSQSCKHRNGNLKIEDLLFGNILLLRPDRSEGFQVDPYRRTAAPFSFDELRDARKQLIEEIGESISRLPGTQEEKDLRDLLLAFGHWPSEPRVEIRSTGNRDTVLGRSVVEKELVINGEVTLLRAFVEEQSSRTDCWDALSRAHAFHPKVAEALRGFGLPLKGRERYVLGMESWIVDFETVTIREGVDLAEFEPPQDFTRVDPLWRKTRPAIEKPRRTQVLFDDEKKDDSSPPESDP